MPLSPSGEGMIAPYASFPPAILGKALSKQYIVNDLALTLEPKVNERGLGEECPISRDCLVDNNTGITTDGFLYHFGSIKEWFEKSNRSPMTNLELSDTSVLGMSYVHQIVSHFLAECRKEKLAVRAQREVAAKTILKSCQQAGIGFIEDLTKLETYVKECALEVKQWGTHVARVRNIANKIRNELHRRCASLIVQHMKNFIKKQRLKRLREREQENAALRVQHAWAKNRRCKKASIHLHQRQPELQFRQKRSAIIISLLQKMISERKFQRAYEFCQRLLLASRDRCGLVPIHYAILQAMYDGAKLCDDIIALFIFCSRVPLEAKVLQILSREQSRYGEWGVPLSVLLEEAISDSALDSLIIEVMSLWMAGDIFQTLDEVHFSMT